MYVWVFLCDPIISIEIKVYFVLVYVEEYNKSRVRKLHTHLSQIAQNSQSIMLGCVTIETRKTYIVTHSLFGK